MTKQSEEKQRWIEVEFVIEFWGREIRVPMTISSPIQWGEEPAPSEWEIKKMDNAIIEQIIVSNLQYGGSVKEVVWATKEQLTLKDACSESGSISGTECQPINSNAS